MITSLPGFYRMLWTEPHGDLTTEAQIYNDQLSQTLRVMVAIINSMASTLIQTDNVSLQGINPPPKTTAEITALEPNVPRGTIWLNSDLKKLQFKADSGLIETIMST